LFPDGVTTNELKMDLSLCSLSRPSACKADQARQIHTHMLANETLIAKVQSAIGHSDLKQARSI
jgi:hypothetical protein